MLRKILVTLATFSCVFWVQNVSAVWEYAHKAFSGTYAIYGGVPTLQEARADTPGDTKVAFNIKGEAAKEMFEAIGPDLKGGCAATGLRVRQRDMLVCRYRQQDRYQCNFGFDLSTGLSIGGSVGGAVCQD